jgi:GDP-mannose 6-dehydrogenase
LDVAIFGLGYVGTTVAGCLTSQGHRVLGIDVSQQKADAINAGRSPIREPGLDNLIATANEQGLLEACREVEDLSRIDLALVCVGTPTGPDGSHDMRYVIAVTQDIARALREKREKPLTIAYRSTMRPGTMQDLVWPILESQVPAAVLEQVNLAYYPEFLRESSAIADFFAPAKIVIGTRDGTPNDALAELNKGLEAPLFVTRWAEAELTKFVDNSWHALKVAFANEMGRISRIRGLDARTMHAIFKADEKLNLSSYYTRPGGPFGGSCLPKDLRALAALSGELRAHTPLIDMVMASNEAHKAYLAEEAMRCLPASARVLVSGLAFKSGTDDLRESPNVYLARRLIEAGHTVRVYDPAIDAEKLVGQNLGYAYTQLPTLATLLIGKEEAESSPFDLAIRTNPTFDELAMGDTPVLDFHRLG